MKRVSVLRSGLNYGPDLLKNWHKYNTNVGLEHRLFIFLKHTLVLLKN